MSMANENAVRVVTETFYYSPILAPTHPPTVLEKQVGNRSVIIVPYEQNCVVKTLWLVAAATAILCKDASAIGIEQVALCP